MTTEQMVRALQALGEVGLSMTDPSVADPARWCCHVRGVEIADGSFLTSSSGFGATPEAAIIAQWETLTRLPANKWVAVGGYSDQRRNLRWNGYMWADVPLPTKVGARA